MTDARGFVRIGRWKIYIIVKQIILSLPPITRSLPLAMAFSRAWAQSNAKETNTMRSISSSEMA